VISERVEYHVQCPKCLLEGPPAEWYDDASTSVSLYTCPHCHHLFTEDECLWIDRTICTESMRPLSYAVGIEHAPGQYGMTDGPFPTIHFALQVLGQNKGRIIRFNSDGTDTVIFRWHKNRWRRSTND